MLVRSIGREAVCLESSYELACAKLLAVSSKNAQLPFVRAAKCNHESTFPSSWPLSGRGYKSAITCELFECFAMAAIKLQPLVIGREARPQLGHGTNVILLDSSRSVRTRCQNTAPVLLTLLRSICLCCSDASPLLVIRRLTLPFSASGPLASKTCTLVILRKHANCCQWPGTKHGCVIRDLRCVLFTRLKALPDGHVLFECSQYLAVCESMGSLIA